MRAVAYWSRRAARLHSSIRGLSPQAGGFRRRSNTTPSVGLSAWLKGVPERLPCVQQVVTSHLLFRIILQYAAVFQPRVLFLFRGTRNILPTPLGSYLIRYQTIFIFLHLPPCAAHGKSDILCTRSPERVERRSLKIGSWKLKRITTRITRSTTARSSQSEVGIRNSQFEIRNSSSFLLSVYGRTTDALASVGYEGRGRLR